MTKNIIEENERESFIIERYGLTRGISKHGTDAFLLGEKFELKTTCDTKGVNTSRNFNYNHLKKWSNAFVLISKGDLLNSVFTLPDSDFVIRPDGMIPWLDEAKLKLDENRENIELYKIATVEKYGLEYYKNTHKKVIKQYLERCCIPFSYILKHGIQITHDHPQTLREIVLDFQKNHKILTPKKEKRGLEKFLI